MKLSIIIPVYNAEKYISNCLDSIINSGMEDYEVICVDDGSIDGSLEKLRKYEKNHDNITVLTQQNSYAGIARNHGFRYAKGEFVHFMDVDDVVVPGAYIKVVQMAEVLGADYIKVQAQAIDIQTQERVHRPLYTLDEIREEHCNCLLPEEIGIEEMLKTAPTPWAAIIRKSYIERQKLEFNGLRCVNDRSFFGAAISHTNKLAICKVLLVLHYVNNAESLVGIRHKNFECHFKSYKIISSILQDIQKEKREAILFEERIDMWNWYRLLDENLKKKHLSGMLHIFGTMPTDVNDEEALYDLIKLSKSIVIYGAGKVGKSLLGLLEQRNLLEKIECIVVSKKDGNPESICGVAVRALDEVVLNENSVVLVAMYEHIQGQVLNVLLDRNVREMYMLKNGVCERVIEKDKA